MEMLCLQKISYNLYNENEGLIFVGLMCAEILNSTCLDFFWNSLFEVYIKFHFCGILVSWSYCYAAVPWFGIDFLFILLPKGIYLVYNDSSVCPCLSYVVSLLFGSFPLVLKKVGLTTRWSGILIDSPTKKRTYDKLALTSVSTVLCKVGLMIHSSWLVYR